MDSFSPLTGVRIQGLMLFRLYHLNYAPALFARVIFQEGYILLRLAWIVILLLIMPPE
jgi:hypothetical protein